MSSHSKRTKPKDKEAKNTENTMQNNNNNFSNNSLNSFTRNNNNTQQYKFVIETNPSVNKPIRKRKNPEVLKHITKWRYKQTPSHYKNESSSFQEEEEDTASNSTKQHEDNSQSQSQSVPKKNSSNPILPSFESIYNPSIESQPNTNRRNFSNSSRAQKDKSKIRDNNFQNRGENSGRSTSSLNQSGTHDYPLEIQSKQTDPLKPVQNTVQYKDRNVLKTPSKTNFSPYTGDEKSAERKYRRDERKGSTVFSSVKKSHHGKFFPVNYHHYNSQEYRSGSNTAMNQNISSYEPNYSKLAKQVEHANENKNQGEDGTGEILLGKFKSFSSSSGENDTVHHKGYTNSDNSVVSYKSSGKGGNHSGSASADSNEDTDSPDEIKIPTNVNKKHHYREYTPKLNDSYHNYYRNSSPFHSISQRARTVVAAKDSIPKMQTTHDVIEIDKEDVTSNITNSRNVNKEKLSQDFIDMLNEWPWFNQSLREQIQKENKRNKKKRYSISLKDILN